MEALNIVIADDHPVVLAGACAILEQSPRMMRITGTATCGRELLDLLERVDCDVLVTDFSMPRPGDARKDGLALLRTLRRRHPRLPIVVMTVLENQAIQRAVLGLGVMGLVEKASTLGELVAAVESAAEGGRYLSRHLHGSPQEAADADRARLSAHELEVVRLFARGMKVKEIADQQHRSIKTISKQKNDAMRKLGLSNHSELYAYACSNGLLA